MPTTPLLTLASLATAVAVVSLPAIAQETPASAAIAAVHYDVTFNAATARQRSVVVEMSFDVDGREPVLLSLPAWTPGSYGISNFARYVTDFGARQGETAVRWEKADHDTWRVFPAAAGRTTVRIRVRADSLDNAMAWSRSDFLLFNGTTVFLYPEGRGFDWPATVTVHTEPQWQIGTAMPVASRPRTYQETNYHDLVDHPFFIGALEIDSALVADRWMRLVTYPVGSVTGERRHRVWDALQRMTPPQVAIFGEVPWPSYNVMQIADSGYGGASGLEHKDSHVNIIVAHALDNPILLWLYAHEIVHAWNVKRLRPAELFPYRYDAKQPTALLWVSEGITDYYADIALVRGGISDSLEFLSGTQQKIRSVAALPEISMEDASLSTWVRPVDGTHYSYYDHGSLAGLLLDVLIRDATDNARSLDDVMRELYNTTYKQGRGFTNEEWWSTVDRHAGKSLAEFRERYVDGRERLPYGGVLPLAGIRVEADTLSRIQLGVFAQADSAGMIVVDLVPGGSAAEAGVRPGDYLLGIGDVLVTGEDFGVRFRERYGRTSLGTPLTIRVLREGRELALQGSLQAAVDVTLRLRYDPSPTARAARIRAGIVGR